MCIRDRLGVDIFSGNKLVFSGNVILTYGDVVNMENILAKNQNGAWEIRTTLTNTSNTTKYNGCVRVVGPEKWVGCAEDILSLIHICIEKVLFMI